MTCTVSRRRRGKGVTGDTVSRGRQAHQGHHGRRLAAAAIPAAELGLHLVLDLGAWWKAAFDLPLPMGGNAIRKDLPEASKQAFARLMRRSVEMAMARHWESVDYAQSFGRGMDRNLVSTYVQGWVNEFTVDPGPRGREAVARLLGLEPVWIQG